MDFLDWLGCMGGVCTAGAAREHVTARELRRLRDAGKLWVPMRGWVSLRGVGNDATRAVELGGVVTCVSAFKQHGLWTPHGDQALHVRVHRETHSARVDDAGAAEGVVVHRLDQRLREGRPWDGVDDVPTSLAAASGCVTANDLLAAADAALQQGKLQQPDLLGLARQLPGRRGRTFERASHLSGSGTESIFAAVLRHACIQFVQQPELLPGEYSDFLLGRSLVIEIDSATWHGSPAQMANDRRRDAQLTALGYRVVRFTYEQVMFELEQVRATVLELVRRGLQQRALVSEVA
ncbi:endonuclease domain-containing protein [Agrococcus baldri]|uniref:DUF559 domain-containing protein n=1 Tax=Agrococcus baldri TaxID=153730 RepID=A0AA87RH06_9MICO|nr:DUF559 domain-containing protein [Agrococcus baldri]GEK79388.1 hypothetical protein ABA31_07390 [Agrococcus baldri]